MNKKIIGIVFLVVSVLLFFYSISHVVKGSLSKDTSTYTLQSNYSAHFMEGKSPEETLEKTRNYLLENPEYVNVIFNDDLYKTSQNSPETINEHTLSIATTLGLTLEENASYYGGYDHKTNACYWLPNGVGLIQVTETNDYYYMVNVNKDTNTTGSFLWTLEDNVGNPIFQVTDLTQSAQGKVTLEPGIYYLYDSYKTLKDVDVQLTFSKH